MTAHSIIETYDFEQINKRNAEFLVTFVKLSLTGARGDMAEPLAVSLFAALPQSLCDQSMALVEIKRLYDVMEGLKRHHMPLAGEPGAPVLCTGCSMHGTQVPWPCETYQVADKALPERRS